MVEISVSTRPDCIRTDYLACLAELQERTHVGINIELGLQTANYHTLDRVHRGHGLAEYIDAVLAIKRYPFTVCTHLIANLPGDTLDVYKRQIRYCWLFLFTVCFSFRSSMAKII